MSIVTLNDRAVRSVTAFGSLNTGSMVFIKKLTASSSSDLSFVNGSSDVVLDSTYKEYVFTLNNIHPSADSVILGLNFSADGGSNYNVTKTTTFFRAFHSEADSTSFGYVDAQDLAQSTGDQNIMWNIGNGDDEASCSIVHLFNPSSTTFVKHFIVRSADHAASDGSGDRFVAGYCNTTSAINGVRFKFASGNIDAGDICLYGIL